MQQTKLPLIAILRGIKTHEAKQYVSKLIELGYYFIEVPLNSPNALETISLLHQEFKDKACIGAGTVTDEYLLQSVLNTGVKFIVTPNVNTKVIKLALENQCTIFVGVMTPTEAYTAIHCGATLLKIYPAEIIQPNGFKAIKAILPPHIQCFPVGGINAESKFLKDYLKIGAAGFGIGGSLYHQGITFDQFTHNALMFKQCYEKACL